MDLYCSNLSYINEWGYIYTLCWKSVSYPNACDSLINGLIVKVSSYQFSVRNMYIGA
jgi:hypothetical protein